MPDEFDLDVEALAAGEEPEPPEPETAPAEGEAPEEEEQAHAMSARKPGLLQRLTTKAAAPLQRLRLPEWNLHTFFYLLLLILILWFLLGNWAPARVKLLVWTAEAPKTILFLLNLLLGAALLRGWQMFIAQRAARKQAEAEAETEEEGAEYLAEAETY